MIEENPPKLSPRHALTSLTDYHETVVALVSAVLMIEDLLPDKVKDHIIYLRKKVEAFYDA